MVRLFPFLLAVVLSGSAFAGCRRADAASANNAPSLVAVQVGDSVRVIARWSNPCDARGCSDSVRVQWSRNGAALAVRHSRQNADTLFAALPAWGDSATVGVAVAGVRRGLVGASRAASLVVRRADLAPPLVDSLRVDTLAIAADLELAASRDSFPLIEIREAADAGMPFVVGAPRQLCALARNRYTGAVAILTEYDITDAELARIGDACAAVARQYATERAG
jgi:hypothetical protein